MTPIENDTTSSDDNGLAVRQIAILLRTMPERTHRVLLGQLSSDEKRLVTETLDDLGPVDAMENYRVLNRLHGELHAETSRVEHVESEIRDEIEIGRARVSKKRSVAGYSGEPTSQPLDQEPSNGPTGGHADSVRTRPMEVHQFERQPRQSLFANGQNIDADSQERMQAMFTQFHQTQAAGILPGPTGPTPTGQVSSAPQPWVQNGDATEPWTVPFERTAQSGGNTAGGRHADAYTAKEIAERVDRYLVQLPDSVLCHALGQVSTKQAFLVLCGLPNAKAEAVLDKLPRRQSRKVRSDMRKMGQLQLSDIDAAKQCVAQIAIGLSSMRDSMAA